MGRYRLGRVIGHGGMSMVYEAWKLLPDGTTCPVAIKRIAPRHGRDSAFVRSLHREARLCLDMSHDHPNLVTVFDLDQEDDGRLFLVMERVDGVNLDELVSAVQVSLPAVRRILVGALQGLVHAHCCGVIHRDISLRNILLSLRGEVKISDFGLARALDTERSESGFQGTAPYASPEAIHGAELDPRADLYSLAAVMYRVITGSPPFGHGQWIQINRRMAEWRIPELTEDVPEDLRLVIEGLLRYAPEERLFQGADAVLEVLDTHGAPVATADELAALVERACQRRAFVEGASEQSLPEHIGSAPARASVDASLESAAPRSAHVTRDPATTAPSRRLWFVLGFGVGILALGGPELRWWRGGERQHAGAASRAACGEVNAWCGSDPVSSVEPACPALGAWEWPAEQSGDVEMSSAGTSTPDAAPPRARRHGWEHSGNPRDTAPAPGQRAEPEARPRGRAPRRRPLSGQSALAPGPLRQDVKKLEMTEAP